MKEIDWPLQNAEAFYFFVICEIRKLNTQGYLTITLKSGRTLGGVVITKQLRWRRENGEEWIGTITIEMAKNKYLKINAHFS